MLKMDLVDRIRRKYFMEALSLRQIARELDCSRNTVRKYINQAEPEYRMSAKRRSPVRDLIEPIIDEILEEWADRVTQKQRVTGSRVHHELLARGHQVGDSTVRRILREKARRQAEVFIPLVHRPGDEAQVDFFEVTVDQGGERRKVWMFLMRLMYSKRDFVTLCERCDTLSFLDAHVQAFEFFGGIPKRIIYDNLSAAVAKIVLGARHLTAPFNRLVNYYQYEPCFARVGRGNDKGGVEARGKGIRLQSLTPIPVGRTLSEISEGLLQRVELRYKTGKAKDGRARVEHFKQEQTLFRELPNEPYDVRHVQMVSIDKTSMVNLMSVRYSLPSRWSRLSATAYVRVNTVEFSCQGLRMIRPRGNKGERVVHYTDYLTELAKKPQAVRQIAPELTAELGQPFGELWSLLVDSHGGRDAGRIMAKVIRAVVDHGQKRVATALTNAIEAKRLHIPELGLFCQPKPQKITVPKSLRDIKIETTSAGSFNRLLFQAAGL